MIAHLRGTVAATTLSSAVIDVGGVGYQVLCTPDTIAGLRQGADAQLATSLVVREDSMTIYGFAGHDERDMFELLQTVSGVGPKVAQAMLAVLQPDRIRQAVATGEISTLTSVPGIGRKGAERLILELKDRMAAPAAVPTGVSAGQWREQVIEAMTGLGISPKDAESAVQRVAADLATGEEPDSSTALRAALRTMSKAR